MNNGTWRFNSTLTRALQLSLSWAESMQFLVLIPIPLKVHILLASTPRKKYLKQSENFKNNFLEVENLILIGEWEQKVPGLWTRPVCYFTFTWRGWLPTGRASRTHLVPETPCQTLTALWRGAAYAHTAASQGGYQTPAPLPFICLLQIIDSFLQMYVVGSLLKGEYNMYMRNTVCPSQRNLLKIILWKSIYYYYYYYYYCREETFRRA